MLDVVCQCLLLMFVAVDCWLLVVECATIRKNAQRENENGSHVTHHTDMILIAKFAAREGWNVIWVSFMKHRQTNFVVRFA